MPVKRSKTTSESDGSDTANVEADSDDRGVRFECDSLKDGDEIDSYDEEEV